VRLIGTTKDTIEKVRSRSHWNSNNIKPSNPVLLGLCKQADLDASIRRATRKAERLGIALPGAASNDDIGAGDQPDVGDEAFM
jgi:hypothetical protein